MEHFEQESLMRDVKITQVEWTTVDTICSLRFSFNNGTSSIQMGDKLELRKVFVFPKDSEIQKVAISVRGQQEYLEAITFWDKNGTELISIRGENVNGVTHTLKLGKYQHINGVQGNMCRKYVRGLGFYVWNRGMGSPKQELEKEQQL